MSLVVPPLPRPLAELRDAPRHEKISPAWQDELWTYWPTAEQWPATLDLVEAAAYKRVHPATLRRHCKAAKLRHQRVGAAYRFNRADLDAFGLVEVAT